MKGTESGSVFDLPGEIHTIVLYPTIDEQRVIQELLRPMPKYVKTGDLLASTLAKAKWKLSARDFLSVLFPDAICMDARGKHLEKYQDISHLA